MENFEILWKKAEQSFVCAYDLAINVLNEKLKLSSLEHVRLLELLKLWVSALENMVEQASDAEMAKDFQNYLNKLQNILPQLELKFF